MNAPQAFDPYAILTALEHHRISYVLIGAFARVLQGTEELTRGVDLVPSLRAENLAVSNSPWTSSTRNATTGDRSPSMRPRSATNR